jgi:RNA polymerase sigma-70 factor, ECF subfamily
MVAMAFDPDDEDITRLLQELHKGGRAADDRLIRAVYRELRRLAARYLRKEGLDESLQPTELVHEAYLRMNDKDKIKWESRSHFYAMCAIVMRHILVDRARARQAVKRGDGLQRVDFDDSFLAGPVTPDDVLAVHEALERFEKISARQAYAIELRFFGGLTNAEIAEVFGVAERTVKRDVASALAWFYNELKPVSRSDSTTGDHPPS